MLEELLSHTRTNAVCDDKGFVLPNSLPIVSTFRCIDLGEYRVIPADSSDIESRMRVFASRGANVSLPMNLGDMRVEANRSQDWHKLSALLSEYLNR